VHACTRVSHSRAACRAAPRKAPQDPHAAQPAWGGPGRAAGVGARRARLQSPRSAARTGRPRARQGVPRAHGQRHERVRKVVPVDDEGRAVPAACKPAQRQRRDGRRHLPSSARGLTLLPCQHHRSPALPGCCSNVGQRHASEQQVLWLGAPRLRSLTAQQRAGRRQRSTDTRGGHVCAALALMAGTHCWSSSQGCRSRGTDCAVPGCRVTRHKAATWATAYVSPAVPAGAARRAAAARAASSAAARPLGTAP